MFAESENIMEEQRNWKKDFLPLRKDLYYIFLESTFKPYQDTHTNKIYFEFIPSQLEISFIEEIAREKSQFTNDNNQDDNPRENAEKINKQITKTYINTTDIVNKTVGEIAFRNLKK